MVVWHCGYFPQYMNTNGENELIWTFIIPQRLCVCIYSELGRSDETFVPANNRIRIRKSFCWRTFNMQFSLFPSRIPSIFIVAHSNRIKQHFSFGLCKYLCWILRCKYFCIKFHITRFTADSIPLEKWLHSVRLPSLTFLLMEFYSHWNSIAMMTEQLSVALLRSRSHSPFDAWARLRQPAVTFICICYTDMKFES